MLTYPSRTCVIIYCNRSSQRQKYFQRCFGKGPPKTVLCMPSYFPIAMICFFHKLILMMCVCVHTSCVYACCVYMCALVSNLHLCMCAGRCACVCVHACVCVCVCVCVRACLHVCFLPAPGGLLCLKTSPRLVAASMTSKV